MSKESEMPKPVYMGPDLVAEIKHRGLKEGVMNIAPGVDLVYVGSAEPVELCQNCEKHVLIQIFKGSGICSEKCRKELIAFNERYPE